MAFDKTLEADGAVCANGKKCELEFDAGFKLIEKSPGDYKRGFEERLQ